MEQRLATEHDRLFFVRHALDRSQHLGLNHRTQRGARTCTSAIMALVMVLAMLTRPPVPLFQFLKFPACHFVLQNFSGKRFHAIRTIAKRSGQRIRGSVRGSVRGIRHD
jgi:hypothetical protein